MMDKIRNFCIIAHIDHGKSTLADRLLELTGTLQTRELKEQVLDSMDLEREKGITIKLQPARMSYKGYQLNLIDTPGHVDFGYEVSRSLAAVEGAILIVDASQGVQAQTVSNVYLAIEAGLKIIPVLNKIDLPASDVERVSMEVINLIGCKKEEIVHISAKTGQNVETLLERVISDFPSPQSLTPVEQTKLLIFDSVYDEFRGVILYIRVFSGRISTNQNIFLLATKQPAIALEVGYFKPKRVANMALETGEIGYIITNLKSVREARVGDTITSSEQADITQALPGYQKAMPYVFASAYPLSQDEHNKLKESLEKLQLNDSSLEYQPESSAVLGHGFRLGFLGLLHLEIIKERLRREYDLELLITNPSVEYQITLVSGESIHITSADKLPDPTKIISIAEPMIIGEVIVPKEYVGNVLTMITEIRGVYSQLHYLDDHMASLDFVAPLKNTLTSFYDQLKSQTKGYGSFSYQISDYQIADLVKLDIYIAGELIDNLAQIVHRTECYSVARKLVDKLKEIIPRQQFVVSIQAAIGGKIIAAEKLSAMGKNVTAKLYGGDVTRKRKLLEKQKAGKKRMKRIGKVDLPPEAFMALVNK